jgi:hypothetical protein
MQPMRLIRLAALATIALCGCGSKGALGPNGQPAMAAGTNAGVNWTLMGEGSVDTKATPKGVTAKLGANTLEINAGKLAVNGADLGRVREGDSVIVNSDGTTSVNGQARTAGQAPEPKKSR